MDLRFAIIENHQVINVVIADEDYGVKQGWIVCPIKVGPGWNLIEGEWIQPVVDLTPPPIVNPSYFIEDLIKQISELQSKVILLSGQN